MQDKTPGAPAQALLREYADLLQENDNQIRRLEALTGLSDPTSRQKARIDELKLKLEASINLEKAKGAIAEKFINKLDKAKHRAILHMRYFDLLDWDDIIYALYGDSDDYENNKAIYQRRAFRHHTEAVKELGRILAAELTPAGSPESSTAL